MKKIIMILSIACTMFASCSKDSDERVAVSRVDINKTTTVIPLGGTERLTVKIYPDAAAATRSVRWFSDDISIASVDETGLVRGLALGTTIIRISDEDGKSYPATCAVSVHEVYVPVESVSLNKSETTLSRNGTEELNYTISPSNATNKTVSWRSNDESVAIVDNNGKVTGIALGTTTIVLTSEDSGATSGCVVTVQDKSIYVTGIEFNETPDIYLDDAVTLTAKVLPSNATNKGVSWESSNTDVATVDDDGVLRALALGTTTITATTIEGGFKASLTVTVHNEMGDVTATDWSAPSESDYEYSMTYIAQVAFRDVLSTDTNVEVAAFVGDETSPRGHTQLVYEPKLDVYLIYLTIFSNSGGGETVVLKAYNPSRKRIYDNCKTFTFQGDTSLGSVTEILNCFP
ncbi:MAG: Ig-like domain-containing protein [Prevotellaceae bacterium]|jgi:uncharacterized protein YjdB|nr:Ig-like domain-containing protein [Prevotellaceae bacterium]